MQKRYSKQLTTVSMTPSERFGRPTAPDARPHGRVSVFLRGISVMAGMAVLTIPYFFTCLVLLPWRIKRIRLGNIVGAAIGRWVCFVMGISHEVLGPLPGSLVPALYVQNHTGNLDLFIAMQLCPAPGSGALKREVLLIPFIGLGYILSGHLLIDRGNRESAIKSLDAITALVQSDNMSVWILPEGTRSRNGVLKPFKKGFAHVALQTRLPIVPVVMHDAHRFWPGGLTVRPGRLCVEVLPPIPTDDWTADGLAGHVAEVEEAFLAALDKHQRPASE
jgi:1-acyl-sn-glycerol-3-phosphate acyltransferase